MKKLNLTQRSFATLAVVDTLFVLPIAGALSVTDGLDWLPALAIFTALWPLRIAGYWRLFVRLVQPTQRLHKRADAGRAPSEEELCRADHQLQHAPRSVATFSAFAWSFSLVLTAVLYHLLVGPPGLRSLEGPVLFLFFVLGSVGPFGIILPLETLLLADASGKNYLLAEAGRIELERTERSVAGRIGVLGLCLTGVSVALLTSAALSEQSQGSYTTARESAHALAVELRHASATKTDSSVLATLGSQLDAERASVFLVGPSLKVRSAGRPMPAWATPKFLALAAKGRATSPDRKAALYVLPLSDGRIGGALVAMKGIDSTFLALLVTVLLALSLYATLSGWFFSRSISVPLERIAALARRAACQGDLSRMGTLAVAEQDEVGQVTINLNDLMARMRSVAVAAGAVANGDLGATLEGDGELPDAFRRMLQQLCEAVEQMQSTSTELASAAAEIFAASQEQEAAAVSHTTGMAEVAQTMVSLSDSAAHVAGAVQGVLENAERTLQNTDQMVARIDELTGHANRIGGILDVIREIAERTDLLALNGSLEATRAGEAGLGFSLVASEMRRLAERVTASVENIKALVADIRESGASTVVATEESKKLAESTTQAARNITLVTQQQQTGTEQVTENIRSVAEVVSQSASATSQTRTSAEGLKDQADRLATLVRRFRLR